MQIEFLETGSIDCPLIRLYGVEARHFSLLYRAISALGTGAEESCTVDEIRGFRTVSGCKLNLISTSTDEGVQCRGRDCEFEWKLRSVQWLTVAGLIEPFAHEDKSCRHQWLAGKHARHGLDRSDISVLLSCSTDGRW